MSCASEKYPSSWVWILGFPLILSVHLIWQLLNEAPPAWDMAFHQLKGWSLLQIWQQGGPLNGLWSTSFPYPPLYHWIEALILGCVGDTELLPFLANLPGLFLLSYGTYRAGRYYLGPAQAGWAGILVLLFPMVAWISRESLLDVPLAGWVAFAGFLVLRSRYFTIRAWVFFFALIAAAGVLTKWTFPLYVTAPVLYGLWKSPRRLESTLNLCLAGILALPITLIYYGPTFLLLVANYPTTEQTGLIPWLPYPRHGEPGLNNYLGWIYYPRVLISYFLFLPLAVLFLVGSFRTRDQSASGRKESEVFLWVWLLGGIVLLTFVTPKDPRFAIPLATPIAILLLRFWRDRRGVLQVIVALAVVQFLLVSFSIPMTPPKLALPRGETDQDFQAIQYEWVAFQPEYFGIAGPPRREDWRLSEMATKIPQGATVGVLPELPRFNVNGLALQAARVGRHWECLALGDRDDWQKRLDELDFVISKDGYQGLSFITQWNHVIGEKLMSGGWELVEQWSLPDGSVARLLKRPGG